MEEEEADLRWVKDQLGHASIVETEGTYGRLAPERHEPRVALLDAYLMDGQALATTSSSTMS